MLKHWTKCACVTAVLSPWCRPMTPRAQSWAGSLINALIFVVIVAAMTFVLFLLFKYGVRPCMAHCYCAESCPPTQHHAASERWSCGGVQYVRFIYGYMGGGGLQHLLLPDGRHRPAAAGEDASPPGRLLLPVHPLQLCGSQPPPPAMQCPSTSSFSPCTLCMKCPVLL